MRHNIPITIRNVFNVAAPGTEIGRFPDLKPAGSHAAADFVKGFATVDNIALVNVEGYMSNFFHSRFSNLRDTVFYSTTIVLGFLKF